MVPRSIERVHDQSLKIENLLSVPVSNRDGLFSYICQKCKVWIVSLEKTAADLKAFKELASFSGENLMPTEETKCTSSDIRVSPDTARERPRPKLFRKRLEFNSEMHTSNTRNYTIYNKKYSSDDHFSFIYHVIT